MCHRSAAAVTSTLQLLVSEKNTIWSANRVAPQVGHPSQSPAADLLGGSRAWQGCEGTNIPPLNLVVASWVLTGEACNVQKSPSCSCPVVQDREDGTKGTKPTKPCQGQPPPFLIEDRRGEVTHFRSQSKEPHVRSAFLLTPPPGCSTLSVSTPTPPYQEP